MKFGRTRTPRIDLPILEASQRHYALGRLFIKYFGATVAAAFSYVQLNSLSYAELAATFDPNLLVRIALVIYYNAWFFGATIDLETNKRIYIVDPDHGRFPWSFAAILPFFCALAMLLFWASSDPQLLSRTLAVFWVVDVILWVNYVRFMKPLAKASKAFFRENGLWAKLIQVDHISLCYITLSWQLKRFSTMLVILIVFLTISHSDSLRATLADLLAHWLAPRAAQNVAHGTPHILFLIYVMFAETTSWYKRMRTRFFVDGIDEIQKHSSTFRG